MKFLVSTFFFFVVGIHFCMSQDSVAVLSAKMFSKYQVIFLSQRDEWLFKPGNDLSWADKNLNVSGWQRMNPAGMSAKFADKSGRAEGWFRLRFKLDSNIQKVPLGFMRGGWAATDLYIDGKLLASFGNTSVKKFKEYNPVDKPLVPAHLEPGREYTLAIHFVDYLSPFSFHQLKSEQSGGVRLETKGLEYFIVLAGPKLDQFTSYSFRVTLLYRSIWISVTLLLALLFWLLVLQNPKERKTLLWIAVYCSFSAISNFTRFFLTDRDISFVSYQINDLLQKLCIWMILLTTIVITTVVLNFKFAKYFRRILIAYWVLGSFIVGFDVFEPFLSLNAVIGACIVIYVLALSRKRLKGAQWAIAVGLLMSILFSILLVVTSFIPALYIIKARLLLLTCFYFSFPASLVVYVSLRFREIIGNVEDNARKLVQITKEREAETIKQKEILEEEVERQTAELRTTLDNLKATQSQLVQSEKMASLGELTAGIAHEIQNPLNFVNNFSEVSNELLEEMEQELVTGNEQLAIEIANDVKQNLGKILHHGKRADAIVKSMLQHSRGGSGKRELTDINALADEYLRLAYHGLRAQDKSFNAKFESRLDSSIGKINVVPQEIGRVILNLINNAFYAVTEKTKTMVDSYEPVVTVTTKNFGDNISIIVNDNGNGIPQKLLDKIFQPFFTTKPTGQGTGLGLSLSYDIITKGHGGELKIETKEGEGSSFIIQLPNQSY